MAQEIYEKTWWGLPNKNWGNVYENYFGDAWEKIETFWDNIINYWN